MKSVKSNVTLFSFSEAISSVIYESKKGRLLILFLAPKKDTPLIPERRRAKSREIELDFFSWSNKYVLGRSMAKFLYL